MFKAISWSSCAIGAAVVCAWAASAAMATQIDVVAPRVGGGFDVYGSGFSGASRVMFLEWGSAGDRDAAFSVDSDTHLVVDSSVEPETVAVLTPASIGVSFREGAFVDVAVDQPADGGSRPYLIHDNVTLQPGATDYGSCALYLGNNAQYYRGGGMSIFFAKSGSVIDLTNGGSNLLFIEDNVTVINGGGSNLMTGVPNVESSTFIPEPASLSLLLAGACFRRRRRG